MSKLQQQLLLDEEDKVFLANRQKTDSLLRMMLADRVDDRFSNIPRKELVTNVDFLKTLIELARKHKVADDVGEEKPSEPTLESLIKSVKTVFPMQNYNNKKKTGYTVQLDGNVMFKGDEFDSINNMTCICTYNVIGEKVTQPSDEDIKELHNLLTSEDIINDTIKKYGQYLHDIKKDGLKGPTKDFLHYNPFFDKGSSSYQFYVSSTSNKIKLVVKTTTKKAAEKFSEIVKVPKGAKMKDYIPSIDTNLLRGCGKASKTQPNVVKKLCRAQRSFRVRNNNKVALEIARFHNVRLHIGTEIGTWENEKFTYYYAIPENVQFKNLYLWFPVKPDDYYEYIVKLSMKPGLVENKFPEDDPTGRGCVMYYNHSSPYLDMSKYTLKGLESWTNGKQRFFLKTAKKGSSGMFVEVDGSSQGYLAIPSDMKDFASVVIKKTEEKLKEAYEKEIAKITGNIESKSQEAIRLNELVSIVQGRIESSLSHKASMEEEQRKKLEEKKKRKDEKRIEKMRILEEKESQKLKKKLEQQQLNEKKEEEQQERKNNNFFSQFHKMKRVDSNDLTTINSSATAEVITSIPDDQTEQSIKKDISQENKDLGGVREKEEGKEETSENQSYNVKFEDEQREIMVVEKEDLTIRYKKIQASVENLLTLRKEKLIESKAGMFHKGVHKVIHMIETEEGIILKKEEVEYDFLNDHNVMDYLKKNVKFSDPRKLKVDTFYTFVKVNA